MKKRPLFSKHSYLDSLADVYVRENGNVGSLPKDILNLMGAKPEPKTIKAFLEMLNSVNKDILSKFEEQKLQIIYNTDSKNFITPFLPKLAKIDIQPERISKIFQLMRKKIMPENSFTDELMSSASKHIETKLKEMNILGPDDSVKVTYVGQGKYKNIFKLELLNKDGENIIHPKALVSFKDKSVATKQFLALIDLINGYYNSISEKQYSKLVDNLLSNASKKVVPQDQIELYKNVLMKLYQDIKYNNGENKFRANLQKTAIRELEFNGIGPESNITQFIKHAAGSPLEKSDFVPFYYLNLKSNVALSEFSDDALAAPTHRVVLSKYGSYHDDLDMNKDNMVLGRVVDYGNIKPLPGFEILFQNPIVRRYNHKFSQIKYKDEKRTFLERIKYWNDLYLKAETHRIPNHNDMLRALKIMKRQIPAEYRYRLNDSGSDTFIPQLREFYSE